MALAALPYATTRTPFDLDVQTICLSQGKQWIPIDVALT